MVTFTGKQIAKETRRESNEQVDRLTIYKRILGVLADNKMTAREIAQQMHERGLISYPVRQAVAPRLTELVDRGAVEIVGKARDHVTKRRVAVYRRVKRG